MSESYIDAGSLNERLERLELQQTEEHNWEWVSVGRLWGQVTVDGGKNLFSSVGIGVRNAKLVIRSRRLTLHEALRWNGQHVFLTSIAKRDRMHLDLQGALVSVDMVILQADRNTTEMTFPGVLTEKYVRHAQEWPMSVNDISLVLVVPKAIKLRPGCLVALKDSLWEVLIPHELDPYKMNTRLEDGWIFKWAELHEWIENALTNF